MTRTWPAVVLLYLASAATAQCRPEGRSMFAAGLKALAGGDLSVAATQFTALVRLEPDCAEARNNLAAVEVEQGRLREAAEELRRVIQVRPDYQRARVNLQRVETLVAKEAKPTPTATRPTPTPAQPTPTTAQPTPTPNPSGAAAAEAAVGSAEASPPVVRPPTPEPTTTMGSKTLAPGIAALEPQGATACVIDTVQQEVCVYTRTAEGIVPGECYPIARSRLGSWPQWVIAGNGDGQPIRLLDETGRLRFRIAREPAAVSGDAVWLRQSDFDSLATKIVAGRTGFVVVEKREQAANPTTVAAVQKALQRWRSIWEQKRFADYLTQYSQSFVPQSAVDLDRWRAGKRHLFEQSGRISVEITAPSIFLVDDGATAITVFERRYRSQTTVAHDLKALRWQRESDGWRISAETVLRQNLPDQIANR